MSRLKRWIIGIGALIALVGAAILDAFVRGKREGAAKQEGKDRLENVEEARRKGDTDSIDKEWER